MSNALFLSKWQNHVANYGDPWHAETHRTNEAALDNDHPVCDVLAYFNNHNTNNENNDDNVNDNGNNNDDNTDNHNPY